MARFGETGEPYPGLTDAYSAGNGSLMRLAPVPLFYAKRPAEAIERAADSSRTTHSHPAAVDACRYFAALLVGAVSGASKEGLLSPRYVHVPGYWDTHALVPEIDEVAAGSFISRDPPEIRGRGYVVATLEAALWAFHQSSTFKQGALLAVNLGEHADTTGAVYGQIAGAYYGVEAIPADWRAKLAMREEIEELAGRMYEAAREGG